MARLSAASIVLGLLAVATLPAAIAYADRAARVELIWAGLAVPVAFVLGVGAMATGRAGERRARISIVRRGVAARIGRLLGLLAVLLAGTGAIALAVYAILTYRGRA